MDNATITQWAARWREDPYAVTLDLDEQGHLLAQASPGQVRRLWMILEDLPDTERFDLRAKAFLACLVGKDKPVERAGLVTCLMVGHPDDFQLDNARRGWQMGLEWAQTHWGVAGVQVLAGSLPALFHPKPEYLILLAEVLADLNRMDDTIVARADWVWSWLDLACEQGERVGMVLEVLARAGLNVDHLNSDGLTALQVASERLDQEQQAQDRKARGAWMQLYRVDHWKSALDCLVATGADWKRLNAPGDMLANQHIKDHPRVRAGRLNDYLRHVSRDTTREEADQATERRL